MAKKKEYTKKQVGNLISKAISENKYGHGVEPNTRAVMRKIKNTQIKDMSRYQPAWSEPIELSDKSTIQLSGETKDCDRKCSWMSKDKTKDSKFDCPCRKIPKEMKPYFEKYGY